MTGIYSFDRREGDLAVLVDSDGVSHPEIGRAHV